MTERPRPVGTALPPRRDEAVVEAADTRPRLRVVEQDSEGIVVPQARDRLLELFEREQMPGDVRDSLSAALSGQLREQQLLFQAMIDTWPRLQKCLREVKLAARRAPWKVEPWSERGEEPTPAAEEEAKHVESAVWAMAPDPIHALNGYEQTIEALVEGYFAGHQVLEIRWMRGRDGGWRPAATKTVPPRYYDYPSAIDTEVDRLMFDPSGAYGGFSLIDFPPNRFLVAVNRGHGGHPAVAAPLRALAGYWLSAVFGLKWFMQFNQRFGQPLRWATYADEADKRAVSTMLEKIGSAGWGAFKSGTELNFIESKQNGTNMPQRELIKLADEQAEIFILGQTLTSSVGDSGSRALGDVHQSVRRELIEGICDFAGEVLTHQLVPAWGELNLGRRDELPGIWCRFEDPKDEVAMATRDETLRRAFPQLEWSLDQIRERHGLTAPVDEDDTLRPVPNGARGEPGTGFGSPHETRAAPDLPSIAAQDVTPPEEGALTVDRLSSAVLEGLTGVKRKWLGPVRPFFDELAAKAMRDDVTDEEFIRTLEQARERLPELFGDLDTATLQEAFEEAIGSALLAGSTRRLERNQG